MSIDELQRALDGTLTPPPRLTRSLKPAWSIEELSEYVAASECIYQSSFACRPLRLPGRGYLAAQIDGYYDSIIQIQGRSSPTRKDDLRKLHAFAQADLDRFHALSTHDDRPIVSFRLAKNLAEIIELSADDQVLVVGAGMMVGHLQEALADKGLCLPLPKQEKGSPTATLVDASLGDAVSFNLPHSLAAQCGSWRDWILGAKVVLADGTIASCGSKTVKSVAGYDVHKLFVGTRGTLGILAEVTLRVAPIGSVPSSLAQLVGSRSDDESDALTNIPLWIQRTRRSDFAAALSAAANDAIEFDPASSTLWARVEEGRELRRFPGDWVLRSNCGTKNLQITDPTQIALMRRAKDIFDPAHKLNPGEMGIF